jgi:flagellar biosynthesis protein FlhG
VNENNGNRSCRIITVAGCKGGVGKSVIACALALEIGKTGRDVVLVDADLGGPNLHTYLGIQSPAYVMSDFLSRRVRNIEEIALETDFSNVRFISSAGNVPSQANPKFAQKTKIISSLRSLKTDFIIIDIGAGSSYDVMDFFSIIEDGLLVTAPEPTSIVNSYGFVKNVLYRRFTMAFKQYSLVMELLKRGMNPDGERGISGIQDLMGELSEISPECWLKANSILNNFKPNIVVNMTDTDDDVQLGHKLKAIMEKYLTIEAVFLGQVEDDPAVRASAKRMIPFTVLAPDCRAAASVKSIAELLLLSSASESDITSEANAGLA